MRRFTFQLPIGTLTPSAARALPFEGNLAGTSMPTATQAGGWPQQELEPASLASVRCDKALRGNGYRTRTRRHGVNFRTPCLAQPPELQRLNELLELPIF